MSELHDAVVNELKTHRGAEDAIELWEQLWSAYQDGGIEAVEQQIETMVVLPEDADEVDR